MGVELDIGGGMIFGFTAIVTIVRGVRRRDSSKTIRERACLLAVLAVIALRGLFSVNSWRVSGIYFAVLIALGFVGLWKGPNSSAG